MPPEHTPVALAPLGHTLSVYETPSALQTARTVPDAQLAAPGLQVSVTHRPLEHKVPPGHTVLPELSPSGAQVE